MRRQLNQKSDIKNHCRDNFFKSHILKSIRISLNSFANFNLISLQGSTFLLKLEYEQIKRMEYLEMKGIRNIYKNTNSCYHDSSNIPVQLYV